MRTSFFALILVIIGIITCIIAITLAFQPLHVTQSSYSTGTTYITTKNAHAGLGSIASGIISAGCFLTAGIRLSGRQYD